MEYLCCHFTAAFDIFCIMGNINLPSGIHTSYVFSCTSLRYFIPFYILIRGCLQFYFCIGVMMLSCASSGKHLYQKSIGVIPRFNSRGVCLSSSAMMYCLKKSLIMACGVPIYSVAHYSKYLSNILFFSLLFYLITVGQCENIDVMLLSFRILIHL